MSALFKTIFGLLEYFCTVLALAGKTLERKAGGLEAQAEKDFNDTVVEIEANGKPLADLVAENDKIIELLKPKFK